jgi:N-acetylmuramoyl-L-alanine amidase
MTLRIQKSLYHYIYINIFLLLIIVQDSKAGLDYDRNEKLRDQWVIVIDPGHGGRDPGAVGKFSYEKNITLAIALKTGNYLKENFKNIRIIYTRSADVYMDLNERSEIANKNNADLFISIHANSIDVKKYSPRIAYGTETYVMGHTKDEQNLEVAMKENEVIMLDSDYSTKYEGFDPKSPESYIMFTLMQNAYSEQSLDLAARMQNELRDKAGRADRGVKQAGFWVLWKTTMPSVLTEIGFISHPDEEKYITSAEGQEKIALALYSACSKYISDIDRKSGTVAAPAKESEVKSTTQDLQSNEKVFFTVQIGAFPKRIEIKPASFKDLRDISEIADGTRFRYVSGRFGDYNKAVTHRKQLEKIYPDAFVIAVKGNKVLPLQDAIGKINRN